MKKKKAVRKTAAKHDDLQWRVSNSLLVLVVGLMLLGYGAATMQEQNATAFLTATTQSLTCEGPQPQPSQYGNCVNNIKSRVVYACDNSTGTWVGNIENADCTGGFQQLPVAYMLLGTVLIALAIASLVLYKNKYIRFGGAKPETQPAAPQW